MILNLGSHAVTVSSKVFVVVCGDTSTENTRVSGGPRGCGMRARVRALTVGAQGGCQHFNALVSDGLPGGELGGQQTPGGCGAGRGGGTFGGVGFGLPVREKQRELIPPPSA